MTEPAVPATVSFAWVAADAVYGVGNIEQALRRASKDYVLGVTGDHHFDLWGDKPAVAGTAEHVTGDLSPPAWQSLSAGLWLDRHVLLVIRRMRGGISA